MDSPFSLCAPDDLKSCFACCPPIRALGYEHIQYRSAIQRTLRENTTDFNRRMDGCFPITGFSCWALGYLDPGYRRIGCLLHPARNQGADLRDRTGFGDKCRREACVEARIFEGLRPSERGFWLRLADGLDSFSYSSRVENPLFTLIGWGREVLRAIATEEEGRVLTRESFRERYPIFSTSLHPKAHAYLLNRVVGQRGAPCLKGRGFRERFDRFADRLKQGFHEKADEDDGLPFTHLLKLDPSFLDYLRLCLGLRRIGETRALELKKQVDGATDWFVEGLEASGG